LPSSVRQERRNQRAPEYLISLTQGGPFPGAFRVSTRPFKESSDNDSYFNEGEESENQLIATDNAESTARQQRWLVLLCIVIIIFTAAACGLSPQLEGKTTTTSSEPCKGTPEALLPEDGLQNCDSSVPNGLGRNGKKRTAIQLLVFVAILIAIGIILGDVEYSARRRRHSTDKHRPV
jgi:hypothetical protein